MNETRQRRIIPSPSPLALNLSIIPGESNNESVPKNAAVALTIENFRCFFDLIQEKQYAIDMPNVNIPFNSVVTAESKQVIIIDT